MISAWRVFKTRFADQALSGEGAARFGGRWNRRGTPMVYLAANLSLALLEVMVHLGDYRVLKSSYSCLKAEFDEDMVLDIEAVIPSPLPGDWRRPEHPLLKQAGSDWADSGRSALLRAPSAVVPRESLYLANPAHPDFARIVVSAPLSVDLDDRLVRP